MASHSSASNRSRESRRDSISNEDVLSLDSTPSPDTKQEVEHGNGSYGGSDKKLDSVRDNRNWTAICPSGNKPRARYYHAAAVVGRKMLVVGGDSDLGMLNDVQQLHLGKLTWSGLAVGSSAKEGFSKTRAAQQLPACRGHSLIAWGKTLLLITGETDPPNEKVTVWSFDIEKESWSKIEAKGEIPVARTGQSVTRAGSVLILFGGEDVKGRKLNDLHMFDLKSLMWLPLHATGTVPSPRAKHVAAMYDDRFLLVFGGGSKSKLLNDLYALDFETMEWSRLKTRGVSPGPRAECASVLFGDKWYIAGGESSDMRCLETVMLDVARMTWSVVANSDMDSPLASQGFSMVPVQRKERIFLVAFGGKRPGPANEVQVLHIPPLEQASRRSPTSYNGVAVRGQQFSSSTTDQARPGGHASHEFLIADNSGAIPLRKRFQRIEEARPLAVESKNNAKETQWKALRDDDFHDNNQSEARPMHERRKTLSGGFQPSRPVLLESSLENSLPMSDNAGVKQDAKFTNPFPKDFGSYLSLEDTIRANDAEVMLSSIPERLESSLIKQAPDSSLNSSRTWQAGHEDSQREASIEPGQGDDSEEKILSVSELKNSYEKKLAAALRKNAVLEGQLTAAVNGRDETEKNLSAVVKSRQKAEKRLAVALKEMEDLKKRVAAAELAQEESNNLSNIVHSENLRLDHDLAFLKAVLEDTQKELHTTRGVLSAERSRAFQLQVELFELKQTIQGNNKSQITEGKKSLHT